MAFRRSLRRFASAAAFANIASDSSLPFSLASLCIASFLEHEGFHLGVVRFFLGVNCERVFLVFRVVTVQVNISAFNSFSLNLLMVAEAALDTVLSARCVER